MNAERCPCLSGDRYEDCCGPLHAGGAAPTAERLMRSRYTAFAVSDVSYLLRSWHPSTRPTDLTLDEDLRWLRLDILGTELGGPFDDEGIVEFRAIFRGPGGRGTQHERSRFLREDHRWYYVGEADGG